MTSGGVLNVRDLCVSFETKRGSAQVINRVNIDVQQGDIIGIVGESGCGKSVTAKTILGIYDNNVEQIEGEIYFKGDDVLELSPKERTRIRGEQMSMIMQNPMSSLNPILSVGEQMNDVLRWSDRSSRSIRDWLFRRDKDSHRRDVISILDDVGIAAPERVYSSYPHELSGGMRQRVLIGMALLLNPDLLIADEPGTALDVTTESKIIDLIKDISDVKSSILYITHDIGVAEEVCDEIYVMYAGEIVEHGSTGDILDYPRHPYTRGLLESVPKFGGAFAEGIEGQLPDYTESLPKCRFADRCPHVAEECRDHYPYGRLVDNGHAVACHLYQGKPEESAANRDIVDVDIGTPPWEGNDD